MLTMPQIPFNVLQAPLDTLKGPLDAFEAPSLPSRGQEIQKSEDSSQKYNSLSLLIFALISTHNGGRRDSKTDGIDGKILNSHCISVHIVIGPLFRIPPLRQFSPRS